MNEGKIEKKIFITGASSGIGKSLAKYYAQQKAFLGLAARRVELLNVVADECRRSGSKVYVFQIDVRRSDDCAQAAREFIGLAGGIDIVIANSGVGGNDKLLSGNSEQINNILSTNLLGVTNTIYPFIPTLIKQRSGTVVGISSVAGFLSVPIHGGYAASKVAMRRMFDSWRITMKDNGIRLVTICPGFIDTPMTEKLRSTPFIKSLEEATPAFAEAIKNGVPTFIYPWQMRWLIKLLNILPRSLVDFIISTMKAAS